MKQLYFNLLFLFITSSLLAVSKETGVNFLSRSFPSLYTAASPVPVIRSFSPSSGPVGSEISILGVNFSTIASTNIVYFGAVRAVVKSATTSALVVTVPAGATYDPITVTVGGLQACSAQRFSVTAAGFNHIVASEFERQPNSLFSRGQEPSSISVKDLDGDGRSDIFITYYSESDERVASFFKNTSSPGTISAGGETTFSTLQSCLAGTSEDLNGDGKPELIVANSGLPSAAGNTVSVLKNRSTTGNIAFEEKVSFYVGDFPFEIAVKDINGDGKADIAALTRSGIVFLMNTTVGNSITFQLVPFPIVSNVYSFLLEDLNKDGARDLVVTTADSTILVYENLGASPTISFSKSTQLANHVLGRVEAGDLDGDSSTDVIVYSYKKVRVFKNTSDTSSIKLSEALNMQVDGRRVSLGNIDGDGRPDLLISAGDLSMSYIFPNTSTPGTISFGGKVSIISDHSTPSKTPLSARYSKLSAADLDLDGRTDFFFGFFYFAAIFKNKTERLQIDTFTPQSAEVGQSVTISGGTFTGATSVKFGGTEAASFKINSPTSITAVVAKGSSGAVSVSTSLATASKDGFTFLQPTPTISSFNPGTAAAKTVVTIRGKNLTGTTSVSFGGINATSFIVKSDSVITAVPGIGSSGLVAVTSTIGTGTMDGFVYSNKTAQSISSFYPATAASGTSILIVGSNFREVQNVTFGGVAAASFKVNSLSSITAVVGKGTTGAVSVITAAGVVEKVGFTFIPTPSIRSFTPDRAAFGDTIVIKGSNLSKVSSVKFGGTSAISYSLRSDSLIAAVVGRGATGAVTITTPGGSAVLAGFSFIPAPLISSFSPATAGEGAKVVISGSNLTGATSVSFGGVPATSFTVNSAANITAYINKASSGSVEVVTPGGRASRTGFIYVPAPTIVSFSPVSAAKGMSVAIKGRNLSKGTSVKFGPFAAASYKITSDSTITAVVGNGRSGDVSVTTVGGVTALSGFTFLPAPLINSFTPAVAGSGAKITISGANFAGTTSVSFGGSPAASFTIISDTKIEASVASGTSGTVTITTEGGKVSKAGFIFAATPIISTFTPETVGKNSRITIIGKNFIGVSSVMFGEIPAASFTVNSATTVTATMGTGASGAVVITAIGGTARKDGLSFVPAPAIDSFFPASAGAGQTVTITGSNFTHATSVRFGASPAASFLINSSGSITAVVGAGSSGTVAVTTAGGVANRNGFSFIAAPIVSSFSPAFASKGNKVTIYGRNFSNVSSVTFGGVPAASYTVVSSSIISAVVATGSSGAIEVITSGGVATKGGFNFSSGALNVAGGQLVLLDGNYLKSNPGKRLVVYPNPFEDILVLNFSNDERVERAGIKVIGLSGDIVFEGIFSVTEHTLAFNLNHLPPAIYVLSVTYNEREERIKVLKY